ncbi:CPBP family intramembrane glutamic endopeptidase [Flavobacteriaceae bacterium LMO-SS05]
MNSSGIIWVLITVSFTSYFIVSLVYKKLGVHNLQSALLATNGLRLLNLKHVLGIILFGVIFYTILPELRFLIDVIEIPRLHVLLPFFVVVFLSAYISNISIKKQMLKATHVSGYNLSNAWVYFSIRFVFLLAYEFFFRGILLYKFLEHTTFFMAMLYSTLLYVCIHLFDSKKEILGTIPFGVVLCFFAFYTNSVWYVFFIHIALSAVYEISMFYTLTLKNKILS